MTKLEQSMDVADYITVNHALLAPIKQTHGIAAIHIESSLWAQLRNSQGSELNDAAVPLREILHVLYLLESLFVAREYLSGQTFPIALPLVYETVRHKLLEVHYEMDDKGEGHEIYLHSTGLCVVETGNLMDGDFCQLSDVQSVKKIDESCSDEMAIKIIARFRKMSSFYIKRFVKLIANDVLLKGEIR